MGKQWPTVLVIVMVVIVFAVFSSNSLATVLAELKPSHWSNSEGLSTKTANNTSPQNQKDVPATQTAPKPVTPAPINAGQPVVTTPVTESGTVSSPKPNKSGDTPTTPAPATPQPSNGKSNPQVIYLTFDDGPSPNVTPKVLDVLKKYQVKATFFEIGDQVERYPTVARQVLAEGHVIGNHTFSHNYDIIYKSPQSYINDLVKGQETLQRLLNYSTRMTRTPGGSIHFTPDYIDMMNKQGFLYVDWNVDSGDSKATTVPAATIAQNVLAGVKGKQQVVILMHDEGSKTTAPEALEQILPQLIAQGAVFRTLDATSPAFHFR